MRATVLAAALALIPIAPGATMAKEPSPNFSDLADEFVYTTLSFSPSAATQTGLHERTDPKTGQKIKFDELLDDNSPAELARQRAFYEDFRRRLHAISKSSLDPQTRADYDLLDNAVSFGLYSIDEERFYERKPQNYAEGLGGALFAPMSLEYADKDTRALHFVARLERVPAFLDQAMANLKASNEIYRKAALEANEGVEYVVRDLGAGFVKGTPAEERYAKAAPAALAALERYAAFIKDELPKRAAFDWRMGQKAFDAKWRYYLQVSFSPDDVIGDAEAAVKQTRAEMLRLAEPLHKEWFPDHTHPREDAEGYLNTVVGEVLGRIQQEHTSRETLVEQTEKDVAEIERFIKDHHVVSITDYSNMRVVPTPEFMRASYGIAGAVFAPALEPSLATFYWVTPIPKEWTDEQAEGRLREYNKYKLLTLHVHEAVPGHVVQGIYANRITPDWRRLLRNIYGNTPYVEGWAVYAEHMMEREGLSGGDPVKMRLVSLKADLRVLTNAIIDIRLHTKGMTEQECVDLMTKTAFQERPEAVGKLKRAQLDYVQLNTYYAGWREWEALRKEAEKREGKDFSQCRYHDTVLLYGPLPVPKIRELYLAHVPPSAEPVPNPCGTK
jgi:uncharacterized protein (DUF885 family)